MGRVNSVHIVKVVGMLILWERCTMSKPGTSGIVGTDTTLQIVRTVQPM